MWIAGLAIAAQLTLIVAYLMVRARRSPAQRADTARWPRMGERMPYGSLLAAAAGLLAGHLAARPHTDPLFLGLAGLLLPTLAAQALAALTPARGVAPAVALAGGLAAGLATVP
ncbi:hypothetical protein ABZ719_37260 [Streptomyces sp. NPDC006743]|uniref:hypothetical protein n=1 Tax=Streptomyces sp. NPDC006743 TaxID=3154480 RepID=UPI0034516726